MHLGWLTDRHIVIKTLLMQNMGMLIISLCYIIFCRHVYYLSAYKGAATMLLLPICLSVYSMNCIFRVNDMRMKSSL